MPDNDKNAAQASERATLEFDARSLVEKEKAFAKEKAKIQPRQVMRVRHMPSEQRRYGSNPIYYVDQDVPTLKRQERNRPSDYSRAYLLKPVIIYSDAAQRYFERYYEQTDQNLIVVTLVLEIIGNAELVQRIDRTLQESFKAIKSLLIDFIGKLQAASPQDENQIASYDHKREYQLPLHTPYSSEFITIVELFDRVNARLDAAWVNGKISSEMRRQQVRDWLRAINDFARGIYELRRSALLEARQRGKGQDARRIEQHARVEAARSKQQVEEQSESAESKDEVSAQMESVRQEPQSEAGQAEAQKSEVPETTQQTTDEEKPKPAKTAARRTRTKKA